MSREYPKHPLVGVGVAIFRGDRVLLIRRAKPPRTGQWSLPGGLQELGETVFQCAKREALEECAVEIEPIAIVDIVDAITPDDKGRTRFHYTLVEVLAEWLSGEPRAGDDAIDVGWHDPAKVGSLGMWPETNRIVAKAASMRPRGR
ncbi:MAG: NUDIX hydrolase [Rhodospirillales bacterium]